MSIIFYHTEEQRQLAEASREREEAERDRTVYTEIEPAAVFTLAEDYHQKYALQREVSLLGELQRFYPSMEDLVDSTAAARINGYLDGYGSEAQLEAEIDQLGLSEAGRQLLAQRAGIRLKD
jgi:hypothetical protein